jgi:Na+-driven multidrug efflux pump
MKIDWKKLLLAFVVVYVAGQVMSYLIHQVWLQPTYATLASVFRSEADMMPKMWIMLVSAAVFSFFFCYVFARGYEGKGLVEGARYGAIIGLFFGVSSVYDQYVVYPIPYSLALNWFLSTFAFSVVSGILAAAVYKPARS